MRKEPINNALFFYYSYAHHLQGIESLVGSRMDVSNSNSNINNPWWVVFGSPAVMLHLFILVLGFPWNYIICLSGQYRNSVLENYVVQYVSKR